MTYSIRASEAVGNDIEINKVISMSSKSPEELLESLNKLGIDWHITEEGTLFIRYWQVLASGFLSPERAAVVRSSHPDPEQSGHLEWLGRNLSIIAKDYAGQWIAIYNNKVVGSARNLPELLTLIAEYDKPFVTFIPEQPPIWNFTYAI